MHIMVWNKLFYDVIHIGQRGDFMGRSDKKVMTFEEMLDESMGEIRKEEPKPKRPPKLYVEPTEETPDGKQPGTVIINMPVVREYYCDDFVTDDLDTALAAGWGKDGSRVSSFGYGDSFDNIDLDWLPEPKKKYSIVINKYSFFYSMHHYDGGENFFRNIIYFPNNQLPETFNPGPVSKPYNFSDQGIEVRIFEKNGYVVFLRGSFPADNLNDFNRFLAFKVPVGIFQKAWRTKGFEEIALKKSSP